MKKTIVFLCAIFLLFNYTVNASYSGAEIYNHSEKTFKWISENVYPLADTDSVASDYYITALSRAGKAFDYNKYIQIAKSRQPVTKQDAHRIMIANAAAGGKHQDEFVADNTYLSEFTRAIDIATAMISLLGGEYRIESDTKGIDKMAVQLLEKQNADGGFDGDILSTAKSIIALSFMSGNCYIVKGEEMGEKYRYDVNSAILRGVNYLQNNKKENFGYGSAQNTAFVVMALDSAGVDADNDPGFSDGETSTFNALIKELNQDGSIGDDRDATAVVLCAIVSHLRAMQGNSPFYALRTGDMPYNPGEYNVDINRSGEGLKIETQDEIEIRMSEIQINTAESQKEISTQVPVKAQTSELKPRETKFWLIIAVILITLVSITVITKCVVYFVCIKDKKKYHSKKDEDEDD